MGLIETKGFLPLIAAVDGALKAAKVSLVTAHQVGGGLVTATVHGEVAAVKAALDAAQTIIELTGAAGMTHVIARPAPDIWAGLEQEGLNAFGELSRAGAEEAAAGKPEVAMPDDQPKLPSPVPKSDKKKVSGVAAKKSRKTGKK